MRGRTFFIVAGLISGLFVIAGCESETATDSNAEKKSDPIAVGTAVSESERQPYFPRFDFERLLRDDVEEPTPREFTAECCDEPGQLAECWYEDAVDDGASCDEDTDCASNACNQTYGVCECSGPLDCGNGVCTSYNLCGPSYCNGYKVCSCFGGCTEVDPDALPVNICEAADLACCNGVYPLHPDLRATPADIGFCSVDFTCDRSEGGDACESDADCPSDDVDCTVDSCNLLTNLCQYLPDHSTCDDSNVCTDDTCDTELDCVYDNNTDSCDDESACTENDVCSNGSCAGSDIDCTDGNVCTDDDCDPATGCIYPFNTDSCDDNNACTVNDVCAGGSCSGDARDCSDGNECTQDDCDTGTGCYYVNLDTPCDDENACTVGDQCVDGICVSGALDDCNDSNICTDDDCDTVLGCFYTNNTDPCDDGNACTLPDVCAGGTCQPGAARDCNDTNTCTDDDCNPAIGCVYTNNTDPCDDSNDCSFNDVCVDGACEGDELDCDDSNICTIDDCDEVLGCQYTNDDEQECDDFNACTVEDRCSLGECAGVLIHWRFEEELWDETPDQVLDAADMYHGTSKNDAYPIPNGKVGQAGRFETGNGNNVGQVETTYRISDNSKTLSFWIKYDAVLGDHQAVGNFSGAGKRFYLGIDRDNQIYAGYGNSFVGWSKPSVPSGIVAGQWARMAMTYDGTDVHVYVNNVEMITFAATFNSAGQGPVFQLGTSVGDVELDEVVVDQRYWEPEQVALDYDNGNGPDPFMYTIDCDDDNPCTYDTCDKVAGCEHEAITGACDDSNACTLNDTCTGGVCQGVAFDCNDNDVCTDDDCDPVAGCVYTDNTASCDDGEVCTENDTCADGTCSGTLIVCNDSNLCTDDACQLGVGCVYTNNTDPCNDLNLCTENDACSGGSCTGDTIDCDDDDPCTLDECAPASGCEYTTIDPCDECTLDADCVGMVVCDPQPDGCTYESCDNGTCVCANEAEGTACTGYIEADYPANCYTGQCDAAGACTTVEHDANNNLCSDAFESGSPTVIDTTADSYLGAIPNTVIGGAAATLSVTGSTLCGNNNYYAEGDNCEEAQTGDEIGANGQDLVYVFRYQTNSASQYDLYSYIVKVEADFDVGIYVDTSISSATECPEGNNPGDDEQGETFEAVSSRICAFPYEDAPMPPVLEEECDDDGNTLNGQECCDVCIEGDACGYKWCRRGYNNDGSNCDMCLGAGGPGYDPDTFKGNCDALWTYPTDPVNCDSQTPAEPGYDDYDYTATAFISPDGATDGTWRSVFIYVDGVDAAQGNFYLTVEKRAWMASPCDRANDDGRLYDVTHVGSGGETFIGSLEGVVNSEHSGTGSCGGYSCAGGWAAPSACHESVAANAFWPNTEIFKIHRGNIDGDATYCLQTDESIADAADIVVTLWQRSSSAQTTCGQSRTYQACERNNDGNDVAMEFVADDEELYLLEVSQYGQINRVCTPGEGDDCNYKFTLTEGACPSACLDPATWYAGPILGPYTVNGATFSPSSEIAGDTSSGSASNYDPSSWKGPDDLWQIDVTATATVQFSCCDGSGSCFNQSRMKLYDCLHNEVASNTNSCGSNRPRFTADLSSASSPYYLLVDGKNSSSDGSYTVQLTYQ